MGMTGPSDWVPSSRSISFRNTRREETIEALECEASEKIYIYSNECS
jgi:hypothetical protein